MAAEYSRQLSEKVWHGCMKISGQGYSAGGPACFGLSRLLLDANKVPIRILEPGEHKQIANERVIFHPKNDESSEIVRQIFSEFVENRLSPNEIASTLNMDKINTLRGKKWRSAGVRKILSNTAYIGTIVYNRSSNRLKSGRRLNHRSSWIITPDAFTPLVEPGIFNKAQQRLERYKKKFQRSDWLSSVRQ